MGIVRITKEFNFEMAHALWNYDGACRNIHGHSYRLFVTLIGTPIKDSNDPKFGMVLDFKDVKKAIKAPVVEFLDHSLVIYHKADGKIISSLQSMYEKVHIFDFQPTCENMVQYIAGTVRKILPPGIELHSLKLYETATSYAEWYAQDNP